MLQQSYASVQDPQKDDGKGTLDTKDSANCQAREIIASAASTLILKHVGFVAYFSLFIFSKCWLFGEYPVQLLNCEYY